MRQYIDIIEGKLGWLGSEHCWWNPRTNHYVTVNRHYNHGEAGTELRPLARKQFDEWYPGIDAGDLVEITYSDMQQLFELDEDPRDAGVLLGYSRINCDSTVTTIPYVIARDEHDLCTTLRWLSRRGVSPELHPRFEAETLDWKTMRLVSYDYDGKRLVRRT